MYSLVRPPAFAGKNFFEFSKAETEEYFEWFLSIKEERMKVLESHVQILFSNWRADHTRDSMIELSPWFRKQVGYRKKTDMELEEIRMQLSRTPLLANVIPISEVEFTDLTVTVCFDVGIYLGESLIRHDPSIKWKYKIKSSRYIYFAQPILLKEGVKTDFNPRAVLEVTARKFLDGEAGIRGKEIIELYDIGVQTFSR